MSKIYIAIIAAVVLFGVLLLLPKQDSKPSQNSPAPTPTQVAGRVVVYKGTSPCADCPGIDLELTLQSKDEHTDMGTFKMKQTYLGSNVKPYETSGNWTVDRGSMSDPDATVYVFTPDTDGTVENYLKVDDKTLRFLTQEKEELPPPYNYTLTSQ